jgi:hypothetical protein
VRVDAVRVKYLHSGLPREQALVLEREEIRRLVSAGFALANRHLNRDGPSSPEEVVRSVLAPGSKETKKPNKETAKPKAFCGEVCSEVRAILDEAGSSRYFLREELKPFNQIWVYRQGGRRCVLQVTRVDNPNKCGFRLRATPGEAGLKPACWTLVPGGTYMYTGDRRALPKKLQIAFINLSKAREKALSTR